MNSALHHISASQMQADAIRDARRNPRLPNEPKPAEEPRRRRVALLRRLRPAAL
jgi:hypothetical protein